jgi:hypothetical protein
MNIFMVLGLLMTLESRVFILVQDRIEMDTMQQCVEQMIAINMAKTSQIATCVQRRPVAQPQGLKTKSG